MPMIGYYDTPVDDIGVETQKIEIPRDTGATKTAMSSLIHVATHVRQRAAEANARTHTKALAHAGSNG
jgi:hypothetical protein